MARVSVGLPLDTLRAGVVLVDTPGLNDTDQFHDYLSYEESLEADCVIFVMDARDPAPIPNCPCSASWPAADARSASSAC